MLNDNTIVKIKIGSQMKDRLDELTEKNSSEFDRSLIRAELLDKVQDMSAERAHKFITDYQEYFSAEFIDVLTQATEKDEDDINAKGDE